MNAQQLKNSILQEAIEGRLVPQDPNDEPASVLLERIRKEKKRLVKEGKLKKKDLEEIPISKEEIPFEIPESWIWCSLGSIISLLSGRDLEPQDYNENNEGIPYITGASNFEYGSLKINRWTLKPATISKYGDLLITCKGTIGTMAFNEIGSIHIARQVMAISSYTIDIKYIMYFLMRIVYELDKKAKSIIPGISREDILTAPFPLPPLAEQHRIVAKIEELLPEIEEYGKDQASLEKLNAELPEQLKKSILQEAIEGRLVPQDPNDEPASVLLERIRKEKKRLVKEGKLKKKDLEEIPIGKDEIPFEIPERWEWCRFGAVVKTYTGKTPERGNAEYWCDDGYPWVSISDMKQGETLTTTKERISFKAAEKCFGNHISPKGSLIMSFKLTVGRTSLLGVDAFHNEAIITIETLSDPELNTRNYYSHVLPLITNWGDSKDAIKGKTLNSKSIYNLLIPMPPYNEQHRIVAKIEQLLNEIDKLKE